MKKIVLCAILSVGLMGCQSQDNDNVVSHSQNIPQTKGFNQPDYEKAAVLNAELALTYLRSGNTARAKDKLNRAMRLGEDLADVQSAHAIFYEALGEYTLAEQYHKKTIRIGKSAGKYQNNYGAYLCRLGRYDEAKSAFLTATQDRGYAKVAETYENLGLCALEQANKEEAKEYFVRALKQDMYRTNAILELGVMSYETKDWAMANHYIDLYRKRSDWSPRALWLGIKLAEQQGNQDSAQSLWLLLKDSFPSSREYDELIESYSTNGGAV